MRVIFLTYIIFVFIFTACTKQEIEQINLIKSDYITNPYESQVFNYFYDDGVYVGNGLKKYMVSIISQKNSFSKKQFLQLVFHRNFEYFPDSISPFTYMFSTNYSEQLNKTVEYRIKLDYEYNNNMHNNKYEMDFFESNISDLDLYKIEIEENGDLYDDPEIKISKINDYIIDSQTNDVVFHTKDLNSYYAFCLSEPFFSDSITFTITDSQKSNTIQKIYQKYRNSNATIHDGASLTGDILEINYLANNESSIQQTNQNGWKMQNLLINIKNPQIGTINTNNVAFDLIISDEYINTHLYSTNLSKFEILKWPNFKEYGKLKISGVFEIEAMHKNVDIEMIIIFKRQR